MSTHGSLPADPPKIGLVQALGSLPSDLVSLHLACAHTGHSEATLLTMSKKGHFPPIRDYGKGKYYVSLKALQDWSDSSEVRPGDSTVREASKFRQPASTRIQGGRNAS